MNDKAGNSIQTANRSAFKSLGSKPVRFKDHIGGNDFDDFLRIKFQGRSSLDVHLLKGVSTQMELQNRRGRVIQKAAKDAIQTTIDAGVYYLRVFRDPKLKIGATIYQLEATAHPDPAGNTPDTARTIPISAQGKRLKDYVGRSDKVDFYAFTLNNPEGVGLNLTSAKGSVKLDLFNSLGDRLDSIVTKSQRTAAPSFSGAGQFNLDAGNYLLRVTPRRGVNTTYQLTANALGGPDPAAHRIQFAIQDQTTAFRGTVKITGVVKNIGQSLFDSNPGQQIALLYEMQLGGTPVLVAQKAFEDLAPGETLKLSYSRDWDASSPGEGEFPPIYRLVISYDPDIYLDGNPFNDDINLSNNQRDRSGSGINALFRG
jgi:hypothetical protein